MRASGVKERAGKIEYDALRVENKVGNGITLMPTEYVSLVESPFFGGDVPWNVEGQSWAVNHHGSPYVVCTVRTLLTGP